jgi:cytochrome oxidase Cu insertion factor (SCO1/SenC/PrrC family)
VGALEFPECGRPARHLVNPGDISMKVNDKAPDFILQDENGKEVALKDLRGKTVVLFFYPRASTPG